MAFRIFLLSPASCAGQRARVLLSGRGETPLASRLRAGDAAPIGEVFEYLSALYFRGKLAYALTFARPPRAVATTGGVLVITPTAGLVPVATPVTVADLRRFAGVSVDAANGSYRRPLERSARALAGKIGRSCEVVLLGSIASPKYLEVLMGVFGDRLRIPPAFVGRGDMSRGGLLLRCVAAGEELEYLPARGAARHGPRPPRLGTRREHRP